MKSPIAAMLASLLFPLCAFAQASSHLRPAAYSILDARVVVEPGVVLPKTTIIIRDGIVVAIGADVMVPIDASVTDGKGLTVYPGFIDAGCQRGFDPALRRSQTGAPAIDDTASDPLV